MPPFSCDGNSASSSTQCVQKAISQIQSVRSGLQNQLNNQPMALVVKGTRSNFPVACQGLTGCVTALNTAKTNIQLDKQNLVNTKENFANAEFTKAQSFAAGAGQALSQASAVIRGRLNALNSALTSLGVGGAVSASPMNGETLSPDPDTGFKMPKGGLEAIAGYVSPPLPNVADANSMATPAALTTQTTRANQSIAQIQTVMAELDATESRCTAGAVRNITSQLGADVSGVGSCYGTEFCKTDKLRCIPISLRFRGRPVVQVELMVLAEGVSIQGVQAFQDLQRV